MSARTLVIGFDSCDIELVERWMSAGHLPHFAALAAGSRTFRLGNPLETLPGAIWPEINMGRAGSKTGEFYAPHQLRAGETRLRPLVADDLNPEFYYWAQASRAGRRVAVVDPVQSVRVPDLNGVQLFEWGLHDHTFSTSSDPPALLKEICARYGNHPVKNCDSHGETPRGYRRLRDGLLAGARAKSEFARELVARERWDLFAVTFSEGHCAGHQFWHFIDPRHPWHDPVAPKDLQEALLTVYVALDRALGEVLEGAGPDALVFTVFSHGIDLYYDGPQLLPEVLVRLGLASGSMGRVGTRLRELKRYVTFLPRPLKAPLKAVMRSRALQGPVGAAGCLVDPFATPKTRAAFVNNNRCGAIRLNVRGREPFGAVEPGAEAEGILMMLKRELLALRDPKSREPIVVRAFTAEEAFGPDRHPDVPDLMCVFRTDLGMIEDCESTAVGRVHVPVYHRYAPRGGDHFPRSRLWVSGAGVDVDGHLHEGHVLDIAPTVLETLSVPLPAWLDGRPLKLAAHARAIVAASG